MKLHSRSVKSILCLCFVGGIAVASVFGDVGAVATPVPGSQGIDTSLPATDSQVTVKGSGPYADLAITVNQTKNLTSQATSITWTGATPTVSGPGRFGSQYLQIMQCWGDDDGTNPNNPGPPPEQCEQGAVAGTYGGLPGGLYPAGFTLSRVISRSDWANFNPAVGHLDTRTTNVWLPFRSVGGTVVDVQSDPKFNPSVVGGNFWLNPYFNIITTNEIAATTLVSAGHALNIMYKPSDNALINQLALRGRIRRGGRMIPSDRFVELLRVMKRGGIALYAPDQRFAGDGHLTVPLFGVPALSNPGTTFIARATGCTVLPYFPRRLADGKGYIMSIGAAMDDFPSGDGLRDLTRYHALIEAATAQAPEQYLWSYKRFRPGAGQPDPYRKGALRGSA